LFLSFALPFDKLRVTLIGFYFFPSAPTPKPADQPLMLFEPELSNNNLCVSP
jgi:hypothetical protein